MQSQEITRDERAPAIDEIVGVLSAHRPAALERLRAQYAGHAGILSIGTIAGEADLAIEVRLAASVAGLSAAIDLCNERIPAVRRRLTQAQRWQFIGQALSLVGGASIFAAIGADFPKAAQYCAAAVTLLGSLASLYARYRSGAMQGGAKNLGQVHEQLIDSRFEALQTKQEIELVSQKAGESAAKRRLVKRANAICSVIRRAESRLV